MNKKLGWDQWGGGSKSSRGANVKLGAPKSYLDACALLPKIIIVGVYSSSA